MRMVCFLALAIVLTALGAPGTANAASILYSPDGGGTIPAGGGPATLPTSFETTTIYPLPPGEIQTHAGPPTLNDLILYSQQEIHDQWHTDTASALSLDGQAHSWTSVAFLQVNGTIPADLNIAATVTVVFGTDLNPGGSTVVMGGFDPTAVQMGGEAITGLSGTSYSDPTGGQLILASNFAQVYPGFDSSFLSSSPTGMIQTYSINLPLSDLVSLPEPGVPILLACGLCALGAVALQRRRLALR